MVGKKGWLHIAESVLSLLIVLGVLLTYVETNQNTSEGRQIEDISALLDEIAKNDSLRNQILLEGAGAEDEVSDFLSERINSIVYVYHLQICEINNECSYAGNETRRGEVFVYKRVVASNMQVYSPKQMKLFIWSKV